MNTRKAISWAKNARILSLTSRSKGKAFIAAVKPATPSKFKQGWREFGGKRCFYRSRWEANYGRYLEWNKQHGLIKEWFHEPQTFWFEGVKRGCVTYLPDFKVINLDDSHEWIEVKGFMDPKSKTKLRRFKKYYPKESIKVVGSKWYGANCHRLSSLIAGWEI